MSRTFSYTPRPRYKLIDDETGNEYSFQQVYSKQRKFKKSVINQKKIVKGLKEKVKQLKVLVKNLSGTAKVKTQNIIDKYELVIVINDAAAKFLIDIQSTKKPYLSTFLQNYESFMNKLNQTIIYGTTKPDFNILLDSPMNAFMKAQNGVTLSPKEHEDYYKMLLLFKIFIKDDKTYSSIINNPTNFKRVQAMSGYILANNKFMSTKIIPEATLIRESNKEYVDRVIKNVNVRLSHDDIYKNYIPEANTKKVLDLLYKVPSAPINLDHIQNNLEVLAHSQYYANRSKDVNKPITALEIKDQKMVTLNSVRVIYYFAILHIDFSEINDILDEFSRIHVLRHMSQVIDSVKDDLIDMIQNRKDFT